MKVLVEKEVDLLDEEVFKTILEEIDAAGRRFDDKTRYVIRGKAGSEYDGLAYGFGIVHETSKLVYLYEDRWLAEEAFNELAVAFKRNSKKDIRTSFEICEVKKEELYTTFKKAQII